MNNRNYEGLTTAQILKYFFIDIKEWVEDITVNGVPQDEKDTDDTFVSFYGLCSNFDIWITREGLMGQYIELITAQEDLFEEYPSIVTPFNSDDNQYCDEQNKYTNPKRLEFINKMVEEYGQ